MKLYLRLVGISAIIVGAVVGISALWSPEVARLLQVVSTLLQDVLKAFR